MRTCWYQLPKFDSIGDVLRRKYDSALQVTINLQGAGLMPANAQFNAHRQYDQPLRSYAPSYGPGERWKSNVRVDPQSLVFFDPSPDYCNSDPVMGYPGTGGRRCNRTSIGPDSCDSMCCGRGFDTMRRLKTYKCGVSVLRSLLRIRLKRRSAFSVASSTAATSSVSNAPNGKTSTHAKPNLVFMITDCILRYPSPVSEIVCDYSSPKN